MEPSSKLRCTGSIHGCDRCRARSISCTFSTNLAKHRNNRSSAQTLSNAWSKNGVGKQAEPSENEIELGRGGGSSRHEEARSQASHNLLEGNLFDSKSILYSNPFFSKSFNSLLWTGVDFTNCWRVNFENDMSQIPMDLEELSPNNPQQHDSAIMGLMDHENGDAFHPNNLQCGMFRSGYWGWFIP
jgi:hypothetical protein